MHEVKAVAKGVVVGISDESGIKIVKIAQADTNFQEYTTTQPTVKRGDLVEKDELIGKVDGRRVRLL